MDGIDTVENMTRCMTNQHSPAEFWRTWHRSYNRWIIRYINHNNLSEARVIMLGRYNFFSFFLFFFFF